MKSLIVVALLGYLAAVLAEEEDNGFYDYQTKQENNGLYDYPKDVYFPGFYPGGFWGYPYFGGYPGFPFYAGYDGYHPGFFHPGFAPEAKYRYYGVYTGKCERDGFYYNDAESLMVCTNKRSFRQPCPPGTANSPPENWKTDGLYTRADFCDINLRANEKSAY